jgi:hypothetical protein
MKALLRAKLVCGLLLAACLPLSGCGNDNDDDIIYEGEQPTQQALANCSDIIVDSYNVYCYRGTFQYVEHVRRICNGRIYHGHRIVQDTGDPC